MECKRALCSPSEGIDEVEQSADGARGSMECKGALCSASEGIDEVEQSADGARGSVECKERSARFQRGSNKTGRALMESESP